MLVVADTGPLNYLLLIEQIDILATLYTEVLIPEEVQAELLHSHAPDLVRNWALQPPLWVTVVKSRDSSLDFHKDTGTGERGAIALAYLLKAQLLLADDLLAVSEANRYGLRSIGTLGLLRQAHQQNLLDIRDALERLKKTSFRYTPQLLERVLRGL